MVSAMIVTHICVDYMCRLRVGNIASKNSAKRELIRNTVLIIMEYYNFAAYLQSDSHLSHYS